VEVSVRSAAGQGKARQMNKGLSCV
jgi:hypothetical protein